MPRERKALSDRVFAKEEALAVIAKAIAQYEEQKEILKK